MTTWRGYSDAGSNWRATGTYMHRGHYYDGREQQKKTQSEPVQVNPQQIRLAFDAWNNIPALRLAVREVKDKLLDLPFDVTLGAKDMGQLGLTEETKTRIVKRYWMPWIQKVYDYKQMLGVVPYYFVASEKVRSHGAAAAVVHAAKKTDKRRSGRGKDDPEHSGDDDDDDDNRAHRRRKTPKKADRDTHHVVHFVPIVPDIFSGYIETYLDNLQQTYRWTWNDDVGTALAGRIDPRMCWIVTDPPTLRGDLTSTISVLLDDWKHIRHLYTADAIVAHQLAHPMHVVEFHPNLNHAANSQYEGQTDRFLYGSTFDRYSATAGPMASPLEQVQEFRARNQQDVTDAMEDIGLPGASDHLIGTIPRSYRYEAALRVHQLNRPHLYPNVTIGGDSGGRGPRFDGTEVTLQPYEHYVSPTKPQAGGANLQAIRERFDRIVAAIVDFPLELAMTSTSSSSATKTTGGGHDLRDFATNRIRALSKQFAEFVETAWKEAYAPVFVHARSTVETAVVRLQHRKPNAEELKFMEDQFKMTVTFPRLPSITFGELSEYYKHGFVDEDEFYRFAVDHIGLPVSPKTPPDMRRKLRMLYDPEEQHRRQLHWAVQEKRAGFVPAGPQTRGVADVQPNTLDAGGSAPNQRRLGPYRAEPEATPATDADRPAKRKKKAPARDKAQTKRAKTSKT